MVQQRQQQRHEGRYRHTEILSRQRSSLRLPQVHCLRERVCQDEAWELWHLLCCSHLVRYSQGQSALQRAAWGPSLPHLGCCTFRPRDVDSLCAAIRALLYLVLHLLPLSKAAKPLCLDAALQDQEQMPGGKRLILLISA